MRFRSFRSTFQDNASHWKNFRCYACINVASFQRQRLMKTRKTKLARVARKRGQIARGTQVRTSKLNESGVLLRVFRRRPVGWFSAHLPRFLEGSHTAVVGNAVNLKKLFLLLCVVDESFQFLNKQILSSKRIWLYHFFIRAYST